MHDAAKEWLEIRSFDYNIAFGKEGSLAVDFGGRYINGDVHALWPNYQWMVVDNHPDLTWRVSDLSISEYVYFKENAARWNPDKEYDLALCTEVFEHTAEWPSICKTAHMALKSGMPFLVTCAGPGRKRHSMYDGGPLHEGEYYENVMPHQLGDILRIAGFKDIRIVYNPHAYDLYAVAVKP